MISVLGLLFPACLFLLITAALSLRRRAPPMPLHTCSRLPEACCVASKRDRRQAVRLNVGSVPLGGHLSQRCYIARHPPQPFSSRLLQKQIVRVANPRHEDEQDTAHQSTNSWDEPSASDAGQDEYQQASPVYWAKVQSLAVLMGLSTLGAVIVLQLFGKTDLPKLAYDSVPESVQEALPEQLGGKQNKNLPQPFNLGAFVQKAQVHILAEGCVLAAAHPLAHTAATTVAAICPSIHPRSILYGNIEGKPIQLQGLARWCAPVSAAAIGTSCPVQLGPRISLLLAPCLPALYSDWGTIFTLGVPQGEVQKEGLGLPFEAPKPDKPPPPQDKVKAERQANFEKSKQAKTARNEQTKREKEQRQKQKEKEKDGTCPSCESLYISSGIP